MPSFLRKMNRHIWQAIQKFSTVCMEGQQDESTFQSPQQLYFQPLPENALYSTVATTVHVPQNNTVKWTINTIQVRYHVRANHCSYTKITISCKKNIYIYIYIYIWFTTLISSLWSVVHQSTVTWRASHFHEEQSITEDDQRSWWPPTMRADWHISDHCQQPGEDTACDANMTTISVFWILTLTLCKRNWLANLQTGSIQPLLIQRNVTTFKSKCHDDYGTWQ